MKYCALFLIVFACMVRAHDLQGEFTRDDYKTEIPRITIPFDGFKKTDEGRVYTLWIAADGALVFYIEKPWVAMDLNLSERDHRFRIWLVEADRNLTLPKGFEDLSSDAKSEVTAAEELTGKIQISWKGDYDYRIGLDVMGVRGRAAFKGYLFGSPKNVAPDAEKKPNQPPQRNAGSRPSPGDSPASETPSSLGPRG